MEIKIIEPKNSEKVKENHSKGVVINTTSPQNNEQIKNKYQSAQVEVITKEF